MESQRIMYIFKFCLDIIMEYESLPVFLDNPRHATSENSCHRGLGLKRIIIGEKWIWSL